MITLSQFPVGLLSLLGAQNFGENAREFLGELRGCVDVGDMLLTNQQSIRNSGALGVGAAGFNLGFTVPQGEVWRLTQFSCVAQTGVGVTVGQMYPSLIIGAQQTVTGPGVAVAASQKRFAYSAIEPIWLPAGAQIGVSLYELVGALTDLSVSAIITALKA